MSMSLSSVFLTKQRAPEANRGRASFLGTNRKDTGSLRAYDEKVSLKATMKQPFASFAMGRRKTDGVTALKQAPQQRFHGPEQTDVEQLWLLEQDEVSEAAHSSPRSKTENTQASAGCRPMKAEAWCSSPNRSAAPTSKALASQSKSKTSSRVCAYPSSPTQFKRSMSLPEASFETAKINDVPQSPSRMSRPADLSKSPSRLPRPIEIPKSPTRLSRPAEFPSRIPGQADVPQSPSRMSRPIEVPKSPSGTFGRIDVTKSPSKVSRPADVPKSPSKVSRPADVPKSLSKVSRPGDVPKSPSRISRQADVPKSPSKLSRGICSQIQTAGECSPLAAQQRVGKSFPNWRRHKVQTETPTFESTIPRSPAESDGYGDSCTDSATSVFDWSMSLNKADVQSHSGTVTMDKISSPTGSFSVSSRTTNLGAARASFKKQVQAAKRSLSFTNSVIDRFDEFRGHVMSRSCSSTTCGTNSPRSVLSP